MRNFALVLFFFVAGCSCVQKIQSDCTEEVQADFGIHVKRTVQRALSSKTLIGGVPADPNQWPASVYMHTEDASCSSTLIGDRVLLSACHCMDNGGVVNFNIGANRYSARCTHHAEYKKNDTADWALCLVDRPVIGVEFEAVAVLQDFKAGDDIRLTGYGCIKSPGVGGNDGIFRIGQAKVTALPYGKNYDIVSKGGAAICFGDSGGAAFHEYPDGSRNVAGVSSRGDIDTMSYLPSMASPTAQKFFKSFAKKNGVKICGIHSDAEGCRHAVLPGDEGSFHVEAPAACLKGKVKPAYLGKKGAITDALKKTMDQF